MVSFDRENENCLYIFKFLYSKLTYKCFNMVFTCKSSKPSPLSYSRRQMMFPPSLCLSIYFNTTRFSLLQSFPLEIMKLLKFVNMDLTFTYMRNLSILEHCMDMHDIVITCTCNNQALIIAKLPTGNHEASEICAHGFTLSHICAIYQSQSIAWTCTILQRMQVSHIIMK